MLGVDPTLSEHTAHLDTGQNPNHAVVNATVRRAVEVRSGHHRKSPGDAALVASEEVAERIVTGRETGLAHQPLHVAVRVVVRRRESEAGDGCWSHVPEGRKRLDVAQQAGWVRLESPWHGSVYSLGPKRRARESVGRTHVLHGVPQI